MRIFHSLGAFLPDFCRIFAEFHGFVSIVLLEGVWSGLDSRLSFSAFSRCEMSDWGKKFVRFPLGNKINTLWDGNNSSYRTLWQALPRVTIDLFLSRYKNTFQKYKY